MKIKELLKEPGNWCQGQLALDYYGVMIPPTCDTACRWSIVGAAIKCYGFKAQTILDFMSIQTGNPNMADWNNAATFEEVRQLIEEYNV